jgi:mRNA interferase MazF
MSPADIVLVKFPFTNLESEKKRPALVLRTTVLTPKVKLVTLAMITSQIDGAHIEGDVLLKEWEQSKLLHPSLVRLSKIATIDYELIDKKIGQLAKIDVNQVKKQIQKAFNFWL